MGAAVKVPEGVDVEVTVGVVLSVEMDVGVEVRVVTTVAVEVVAPLPLYRDTFAVSMPPAAMVMPRVPARSGVATAGRVIKILNRSKAIRDAKLLNPIKRRLFMIAPV